VKCTRVQVGSLCKPCYMQNNGSTLLFAEMVTTPLLSVYGNGFAMTLLSCHLSSWAVIVVAGGSPSLPFLASFMCQELRISMLESSTLLVERRLTAWWIPFSGGDDPFNSGQVDS